MTEHSEPLRKTFFMVARTFSLDYEYGILIDFYVHVEVHKPNWMESQESIDAAFNPF
jgi:hypothetical protein